MMTIDYPQNKSIYEQVYQDDELEEGQTSVSESLQECLDIEDSEDLEVNDDEFEEA